MNTEEIKKQVAVRNKQSAQVAASCLMVDILRGMTQYRLNVWSGPGNHYWDNAGEFAPCPEAKVLIEAAIKAQLDHEERKLIEAMKVAGLRPKESQEDKF